MRGGEDNSRGTGLCGKTVDGMELHHFMAEGLDNAPTTDRGAGRHDERAGDFDPERDPDLARIGWSMKEREPGRHVFQLASISCCEKGEGNDAHGFLRIVGPVHKTHSASTAH